MSDPDKQKLEEATFAYAVALAVQKALARSHGSDIGSHGEHLAAVMGCSEETAARVAVDIAHGVMASFDIPMPPEMDEETEKLTGVIWISFAMGFDLANSVDQARKHVRRHMQDAVRESGARPDPAKRPRRGLGQRRR
jgi:endonuclease IV